MRIYFNGKDINDMVGKELRAILTEVYGVTGISRTHVADLRSMLIEKAALEGVEEVAVEVAVEEEVEKDEKDEKEEEVEEAKRTPREIHATAKKGTATAFILSMYRDGYSVSEIAKTIGKRYQMVYNILKNKGVL